MNRTIGFGIAVFLALVGIGLVGGQREGVAGHGCCGCRGGYGYRACDGCSRCCHGGCYGGCWRSSCRGASCRGAYGCEGTAPIQPGGEAPAVPPAPGEEPAPAPGASADFERAPIVFQQVHFRR
jgi:hypothetical protein